jgi:putative ABC transport system permease protein
VVGGVGIMNVLMMSVKERTKEIGVRKAVGARKNDIVFQFMIESVTISSVGCLVGLLTGLTAVFVITPIIRSLTDIPFQAGFSLNSLIVIAVTAGIVGITFGTYPAYSAAKLSPTDAIRHE